MISITDILSPHRPFVFDSVSSIQQHPGILAQMVVTPIGTTSEGQLVKAIAPAWFQILRLLREDPDNWFKIDPRKLEELIAAAYDQAGFEEVTLTPRSGDYGRDVIAVKHGYCSLRVIDSVKRFNPQHLVDANDVRALLGVLSGDRNATKGIVTTTSDFAPMISTDPFISPFIPYRLELVNGRELQEKLEKLV